MFVFNIVIIKLESIIFVSFYSINPYLKVNRTTVSIPKIKRQSNPYLKNKSHFCVSFLGNYGDEALTPKRTYSHYDKIYIGKITQPITILSPNARTRATAKYEDFSFKDFSNYIFNKSNFYKSNFQHSNFENTDLRMCNLSNTNFSNSEISHTDFSKSNLSDASFENVKFKDRVEFVGVNLLGADFSNTDLEYVNLNGALYNDETIFPDDFNPEENQMICIENNKDYSVQPKELYSCDNDFDAFEYVKLRYVDLSNVKFNNC